jgi:outer membrane immunogenic protein
MRQMLRPAIWLLTTIGCCGVASAADMPIKAPPAPVYYNWTGFYLGVNIGGSWGRQCAELFDRGSPVASGCIHPNDVIGGGQIGYNWQFGPWFGFGNGTVLGLEADFQGSRERADYNFGFAPFTAGGTTFPGVQGTLTDKLEWFGTARGRAGIAFDRWLPYVTGGYAYGNRKFEAMASIPGATASFSNSNTLSGWTVGGGVEWAFWQNWTAKVEYLYIDFSNNDSDFSTLTITTPTSLSLTANHFKDNIVRAGVNYKFW